MAMSRYGVAFPQFERRDLRKVELQGEKDLSDGWFLFDELYCAERHCDCKRVMVDVFTVETREHLATIVHQFGDPDAWDNPKQTFVDPLNPQTEVAGALLEVFEGSLGIDGYAEALERHYRQFKRALGEPNHAIHARLKAAQSGKTTLHQADRGPTVRSGGRRRGGAGGGPNRAKRKAAKKARRKNRR